MWRSFFFACGTMLFILGLECLVTEQFIVVDGTPLSSVVAKVLDGNRSAPALQQSNQPAAPGMASRFGPSRFNDSPFDNQYQPSNNFYGGVPGSTSRQGSNSQFSLAGFGTQTQPGIAPAPQPTTVSAGRPSNIIKPKEWMPWSLLAAGAIVVLYTNTTSRHNSA